MVYPPQEGGALDCHSPSRTFPPADTCDAVTRGRSSRNLYPSAAPDDC